MMGTLKPESFCIPEQVPPELLLRTGAVLPAEPSHRPCNRLKVRTGIGGLP